MADKKAICAWCYYARMRRDLCGIYCTGGFTNEDGSCDRFKNYQEMKAQKRKEAKKHATAAPAG